MVWAHNPAEAGDKSARRLPWTTLARQLAGVSFLRSSTRSFFFFCFLTPTSCNLSGNASPTRLTAVPFELARRVASFIGRAPLCSGLGTAQAAQGVSTGTKEMQTGTVNETGAAAAAAIVAH